MQYGFEIGDIELPHLAVRTEIEVSELLVDVSMVVESDHPVNGKFTDYITVETGLENLALQLSLLVAFDENRLRNIRLGSLVRTMLDPRAIIADPVQGALKAAGGTIACVCSSLFAAEITELNLKGCTKLTGKQVKFRSSKLQR